jgi:benzaldehyde dehydrogenase (NAD)
MTSIINRPTSAHEHTEPWRQKVYSNGWTDGRGEQIAVTDKATGVVLGSIGSATTEDLDDAVAAARTAQRGWAAASYSERAAVLLHAAAILEAEPDRLLPWLIREAGSAQGKAAFELSLVVSELRESAAAASAPYGELLRSTRPRLSMARHAKVPSASRPYCPVEGSAFEHASRRS